MTVVLARMTAEQAYVESICARFRVEAPKVDDFEERQRQIIFTAITGKLANIPEFAVELHHTGHVKPVARRRRQRLRTQEPKETDLQTEMAATQGAQTC